MKSLPGLLAARDFKDVVDAIVAARRADKAIIWGLGAHVLKTGLSPVLVDLMERGFVSAIATNGAGIIHDFEIALSGGTSEDVDATLGPGAIRHGRGNRRAVEPGDPRRRRRGPRARTVGRRVSRLRPSPPFAQISVVAAAAAAEDPGDGSRRDRYRHHPHASAGVGRGDRRGEAFATSGTSCRRWRGSKAASI